MDLNQRAMAAKQFLINKAKNHAFVQSIQQRSLAPYKESFERAIEPSSLMPMGRAKVSPKFVQKVLSPESIRKGAMAFENEASQFKAIQYADSAKRTAERIKQFHAEEQAKKAKEMMARAFSGFLQRSKNMSNFQNGL